MKTVYLGEKGTDKIDGKVAKEWINTMKHQSHNGRKQKYLQADQVGPSDGNSENQPVY